MIFSLMGRDQYNYNIFSYISFLTAKQSRFLCGRETLFYIQILHLKASPKAVKNFVYIHG